MSQKKKIKQYKGINIITIPTINIKSVDALLYSFFATIRAIFFRYDVIHYHAEGPCVMLLIPHLFGIRTVATIHGLDWKRAKWGGIATKYLKIGEKIAAKYADEVIVLSRNIQKYFKDTYERDTNYIPNGVNNPTIRKADIITKKYNLKKDDYILFLARIVPEKGLHYLIEAFKDINTNKKLVIAGGSSHSNEYLDKIKKMVSQDERVIMTGFVQGSELEELYSNAYLYILPSDVEGMPISLLEAMSYGNCCLVSDIKENIEVGKSQVVNFKRGNIIDLKNNIEILLDDTSRLNHIRRNVSEYVLSYYKWDKVLDSTINLYTKL